MTAERSQRGREEFDRFVDEAGPVLLRTADLVLWDHAAAEDLVQECLLRVARRWPRVRAMDQRLAYARRILLNLALRDAERRARRRGELVAAGSTALLDPADAGAEMAFAAVDSSTAFVEVLSTLAPRQRAVLALRFFDDLTEVQVAAALGCSVGTVKSTTARALERLRGGPSVVDLARARTRPERSAS
ncbi:MAG TPA: sigma-70 family RNA polymerase sigma factor [Acidimicrobiales bacterium]|nr:sigma-70 family RNA polymerase sigma factor [Acidimicrobiales bacterium]